MATIKQKQAFNKLAETNGNVSKAMREAGYSPNTNNPSQLTESKGWQELMDEYLPESDLVKVHKEGLKATTFKGDPDFNIRHKYLETGYKVRGKLSVVPDDGPITVNINIANILGKTYGSNNRGKSGEVSNNS